MKIYSMKNKAWADIKIGKTNLKIGVAGCYIVSIAIIDGRTPLEINAILTRSNCFNNAGELLNDTAAKVLGYTFEYFKSGPPPVSMGVKYPVICETDHYVKLGYKQHFYVKLDNGKRIDPLDIKPQEELDDYHIVSYRNWIKRENNGSPV